MARRLEQTPITQPIIAVTLGIVLGTPLLGVAEIELADEVVVGLTEATLALLLFSDAAAIDSKRVRSFVSLPARLLLISLPLVIILGTLVTRLLLSELSWAESALLATMLAPTDAALGQAVVTNPRVPERIRETLDIESGLNDGLVVPVFFTVVLVVEGEEIGVGEVIGEAARSIGVGAAVGLVLGGIIGWLFKRSAGEWSSPDSLRLGAVGVIGLVFVAAVETGGNAFIAAFVAGLALRAAGGKSATEWRGLPEDLGVLGAFAVFVIFGASFVEPALSAISFAVVVCAIVTLTVGRMLPTAISLIGTGLKPPTVAFLGWFGPRGLASVLFGLLLLEEGGDAKSPFFAVVTIVVLLSVYLHGLTAAPLSQRYGSWYDRRQNDEIAECLPAPPITPQRRRGH